MLSGGKQGQVIEHVRALAAELVASVGELPTTSHNSPVRIEEPRALSTEEAARLLGVTPYTLREWARLGKIRCRQDSPRGRRFFDLADVAAYKAAHMTGGLTNGLDQRYTGRHDTQRRMGLTAQAQNDPSRASGGPRGNRNDGRPVGTRKTHRRPASRGRPFAPGIEAWSNPPRSKTRPPESEG